MELKDLKLNKFGEFLYPTQGVHGGEKTTVWIYDDDPFKHKDKYNPNGNPFKAQDYIQFNATSPSGYSHVYRTFSDPIKTYSLKNGRFIEKYRVYSVRCPDDYQRFPVFIRTIEENNRLS